MLVVDGFPGRDLVDQPPMADLHLGVDLASARYSADTCRLDANSASEPVR